MQFYVLKVAFTIWKNETFLSVKIKENYCKKKDFMI